MVVLYAAILWLCAGCLHIPIFFEKDSEGRAPIDLVAVRTSDPRFDAARWRRSVATGMVVACLLVWPLFVWIWLRKLIFRKPRA